MKKVNFKTVLMALFVAFAFLFVGVNGADAQTIVTESGNSIYAVPQGDFASGNDALMLLEEAKNDIKVLGNGASPAVLAILAAQYNYYDEIGVQIESGVPTSKAIVGALAVVAEDAPGGVNASQQATIKQEAIDLLSL